MSRTTKAEGQRLNLAAPIPDRSTRRLVNEGTVRRWLGLLSALWPGALNAPAHAAAVRHLADDRELTRPGNRYAESRTALRAIVEAWPALGERPDALDAAADYLERSCRSCGEDAERTPRSGKVRKGQLCADCRHAFLVVAEQVADTASSALLEGVRETCSSGAEVFTMANALRRARARDEVSTMVTPDLPTAS